MSRHLKTTQLLGGGKLMGKVTMGPQTLIYPMPALLVGANVDGKPNFMVVAWSGIANGEPPMISVAIRHHRYTLGGIRQNMAFSANVPSADMVVETDYCGITSGSKANKVDVCQFRVFYGKLGNAPLIEQCPVNLECKVVHILDLGSHSLVIGRIEETHITEDCLTDGKPDVNKIKPFVYTTSPARQYQAFGNVIAKAFSIGEKLRAKSKRPE
jgi:flavin reductase (DIM6/NTAB) family NADH-FMN oxidoreductase RutF